jgi:hypothetical protein
MVSEDTVGGGPSLSAHTAGVAALLSDPETVVRAVEFSWDDLGPAPRRWNDRGIEAPLSMAFWWTYLRVPNRRPILLIRTFANGGTMLGHHEVAEGFWHLTEDRLDDPYDGPGPILPVAGDPEGRVDDPVTWAAANLGPGLTMGPQLAGMLPEGMTFDDLPLEMLPEGLVLTTPPQEFLYRASSRYARTVERDFFDATWTYMPYAICIDPPGPIGPYFTWAATIEGTYHGQPFKQTGGFDRMYGAGATEYMITVPTTALVFSALGVDGTREMGVVYQIGSARRSAAIYWKDGEDPVVSDKVDIDATYVQNKDDPSQIAVSEATFHFGGKEISWAPEHMATTGVAINHFGHATERNGPEHATYPGAMECKIMPGTVEISGEV